MKIEITNVTKTTYAVIVDGQQYVDELTIDEVIGCVSMALVNHWQTGEPNTLFVRQPSENERRRREWLSHRRLLTYQPNPVN